jgi:hypothetical protein
MWVRTEEGYGTVADCQRFADDGFTYETHFDDFCSDWVPRWGAIADGRVHRWHNARTTGELVRCRDCVFMETRQLFGGIDAKCYLDPEFNIFDGPDGCCSKAKRRRDGSRD